MTPTFKKTLANTPAQVEFMLHCLKQAAAAGSIHLYVNAKKKGSHTHTRTRTHTNTRTHAYIYIIYIYIYIYIRCDQKKRNGGFAFHWCIRSKIWNLNEDVYLTRVYNWWGLPKKVRPNIEKKKNEANVNTSWMKRFWRNTASWKCTPTLYTLQVSFPAKFSCWLNWKFISSKRFENVDNVKSNMRVQLHIIIS